MPLQDFNLFYLTRLGYAFPRSLSSPGTPGRMPRRGTVGCNNLPAGTAARLHGAEIRQWLELFLRRLFTQPVQRVRRSQGRTISRAAHVASAAIAGAVGSAVRTSGWPSWLRFPRPKK